jgi:hypothetical protein
VVSEDFETEQPRWAFWLYGTGLVAAIVVVATLMSPWVRNEWKLSLGRENSPSTQLGFKRAAALPATAVRGKSIPVSFVITNNEGKQVAYQYVVSSGSRAKLETLTSATKVVANGASWAVDVNVVPKCAASACRIQVSIPQQRESIDFAFTYSTKTNHPSKAKQNKYLRA